MFSLFEDVPSEIAIFGIPPIVLTAILTCFLASQFVILRYFENDIKTMLRTSHCVEDAPSEVQIFGSALRSGPPCCRSLSEDVPSEIAILNIRVS
eukprot:1354124-Pyramimonas_sp.AAC.1